MAEVTVTTESEEYYVKCSPANDRREEERGARKAISREERRTREDFEEGSGGVCRQVRDVHLPNL